MQTVRSMSPSAQARAPSKDFLLAPESASSARRPRSYSTADADNYEKIGNESPLFKPLTSPGDPPCMALPESRLLSDPCLRSHKSSHPHQAPSPPICEESLGERAISDSDSEELSIDELPCEELEGEEINPNQHGENSTDESCSQMNSNPEKEAGRNPTPRTMIVFNPRIRSQSENLSERSIFKFMEIRKDLNKTSKKL